MANDNSTKLAEGEFQSARPSKPGLGSFLAANRGWWIIPGLVVVAIIVLLVVLTSTSAAPYVFELF